MSKANPELDEQLKIVARLKTKILKRFEDLLDGGEMTATDAATCTRLLIESGWDLSAIPGGLASKLGIDVDGSLPDVEAEPEDVWT